MHSQHIVALDDSHPDSRTNRSVHAGTGSAHIHDGHVNVALLTKRETSVQIYCSSNDCIEESESLSHLHIWGVDVSQQLVRVPVVLKTPAHHKQASVLVDNYLLSKCIFLLDALLHGSLFFISCKSFFTSYYIVIVFLQSLDTVDTDRFFYLA